MVFYCHLCPPKPWITKALRIVKLIAIILLIGCLQVSAKGWGQPVTLNEKGASLETVFEKIKQQTGIIFWYRSDLIEKAKPVTINVKNAPLQEVLKQVFKDQPLSYAIIDNKVFIKPKTEQSISDNKQDQPIDIKGKEVKENGMPVEGVTVTVKGSNKTTVTDANGEFYMITVEQDAILVFTHVSMETFELKVKGQSEIAISLKSKVSALDELQVIAYGTSTKRLNTGNVSVVKSTEIEQQPVSNPLLTLGGRVPGMFVTQQSGVPGSSISVQIRGRNSIANGNDPLYIIDGVPYASQMLPNNGSTLTNGGNPFNFISPSNIESITVLKDADATAIYGSRGANGVVLITTKKGKAGETRVNANVYGGYGKITRKAKLLNTQQYLEARREAFKNDGRTPVSFDYDVNGVWDTTAYTDWQEELIGGSARYSDAQVSISGGNNNTQYLIGSGYHKETTVFPGNFSNQKSSVYFNINSSSSNQKFKVLLSGNYVADKNNLMYFDLTSQIYLAPNAPSGYKSDGTLNWDKNNDYGNPYAILLAKYKTISNTLVGNSVLSYKILPELELKSSFGYTHLSFDDKQTFPSNYFPPSYNITTGSANFSNSTIRTWIIEPQLVFDKTIGKNKVNVVAGASFQDNRTNGEVLKATGYNNNDLLESLAGAASVTKGTITNTQYKYNSIFGRINYKFDDRYILNLTGRRDGSSRFGPDKRFANFGSAGVGWILSNTKFIKDNLSFLNFGKLRASYGTTGNDQIPDYLYQELYNFTTGLPYQGSTGLSPNNLANPVYAWEVNKKLEIAAEFGFLHDKIFLSASYFKNRTSNQLVGYVLPDITGFTTILGNLPAVVENNGWEFILNSTSIKTQRFTWTTSINLTIPKNKLVSFPNFEKSSYASIYAIGQPLNIVKVFHLSSVDPTTGIYQFTDAKGDLTSTPDPSKDRIDIINLNPKYYGGFQNSFKYENFEIDFLFQFVKQTGKNYLFGNFYPPGMGFGYYNPPVEVLDRWQKTGDIAPYQRYTQRNRTAAYRAYKSAQTSNYAYSDASFIRLKNVSLSYQFSKNVLDKLHLRNLRVYMNAQNLLTITNYIGLDPENQSYNALPPLRVVTAGIQLTL